MMATVTRRTKINRVSYDYLNNNNDYVSASRFFVNFFAAVACTTTT